MPAQQRLHINTKAAVHRLEMSDRFPSPHDREVLPSMLYRIEQIREVPGRVRSRHIRH